jgi:hypothetical protein
MIEFFLTALRLARGVASAWRRDPVHSRGFSGKRCGPEEWCLKGVPAPKVPCKPMVMPGGSASITRMSDFSVVLGPLGRDTVHEGHGGHPLRRGHASPR